MKNHSVSIVKYEEPIESVRKAIDLSNGLDHLPENASVFIKPNIAFWFRTPDFPKWGVVTTSRVIEDVVLLLKERGIDNITIGEGTVIFDPKDKSLVDHAFDSLGYNQLKKKYDVKSVNIFEGEFEKVDLGGGVALNCNTDLVISDFVVNIPVLKTHLQTKVSLGIKNLKGVIDIKSRKKCHSVDEKMDLHYYISKLGNMLPPSLTLIDGIFSNAWGPGFDGRAKRSDILIASADPFSADKVGASILGYDPADIIHLDLAAKDMKRPINLSDVDLKGEKLEGVISEHGWGFPYTEGGLLPKAMEAMGIEGLTYRKYDDTLCTYCSGFNSFVIPGVARAWSGEAWDDVEVLTGKKMKPTQGKKKTVLLGKCIYQANKDNPDINEMIPVKGCPPAIDDIIKALQKAGINIDPDEVKNVDKSMAVNIKKYAGKPEFSNDFFMIE